MNLDDGVPIRLNGQSVEVIKVQTTIKDEWFTPNVIEPSFGINRIIQAVLEHSFCDTQYGYFRFSPLIAPQKCGILPLNTQPIFDPFISQICK